ncbi:MAG: RNase adapter RapZ [Candidatus Aminicenantes bacterium]|nr:RNase adapter RapZ [Candidatus Aminicenantes bacterium]
MIDDNFLIITGLSGSGKTTVSRFLEDFGYYCVDNLPSKLIPNFVDLWKRKEVELTKVALIVDIREEGFLAEFPKVLKSIRKKITPRVIFLEASDETLIKRFSESRRPHPLKSRRSVRDNVVLERTRLAEIKNISDEVINTTATNIADLREMLSVRFVKKAVLTLQVAVVSFGYKYGIPLEADLVFDTRFLPNPFYEDKLREKTGKNKAVRTYVLEAAETQKFLKELFRFITFLMPRFVDEGKSYLTIAIGCTGGKHRSVVLSEELGVFLKESDYRVQISHRDIYK